MLVLDNSTEQVREVLLDAQRAIQNVAKDYELIVVNNAVTESVDLEIHEMLVADLANTTILTLVNKVDSDFAFWAGIDAAIGDFTAVVDLRSDNLEILEILVEKATSGNDIVLARNSLVQNSSIAYRLINPLAGKLFQLFTGVKASRDAPRFRVLSRNYINFLLRHSQPALTYRNLPDVNGFRRAVVDYEAEPMFGLRVKKTLPASFQRGLRVMFSTSRLPLRIVALASFLGAFANLAYSVYVIAVALTQSHVAPGWTSASLQQSGMFFLISLVLFVLCEYVVQVAGLANGGPGYFVAREAASNSNTLLSRLNLDEK